MLVRQTRTHSVGSSVSSLLGSPASSFFRSSEASFLRARLGAEELTAYVEAGEAEEEDSGLAEVEDHLVERLRRPIRRTTQPTRLRARDKAGGRDSGAAWDSAGSFKTCSTLDETDTIPSPPGQATMHAIDLTAGSMTGTMPGTGSMSLVLLIFVPVLDSVVHVIDDR